MAMVNVSLDTNTRQAILTINGVLVTTDDFHVSQWVDSDGEKVLSFSYVIEDVDGNGMSKRVSFTLPTPQEAASLAGADLDERGFTSKIVYDDEKAKADTIKYLNQGRKQK